MAEDNFISRLAKEIQQSTVQVQQGGVAMQVFRAKVPESVRDGISKNVGSRAGRSSYGSARSQKPPK